MVGPDHDDKDAALFPQLINGKFAVVHRIEPNIEVAFFDSIQQMERVSHNPYAKNYLKRVEANTIMKPRWKWEEKKVGIGPPPIRTDAGWIIIYHGVDSNTVYRAGAALLDLENPCRVIARTPEPILEPEEKFEKVGVVPNVVFPEGAVVIKDELKVFYGGADKVCCVASVPLRLLIESLEHYESLRLPKGESSGLEDHQQNLIRKVVRDFLSVVVILILFYLLTPFIVLMPGIGASFAAAIPLILAAVVIILLYDAGRLLYDEIAKSVHKVSDKIASMVEESEKSKK